MDPVTQGLLGAAAAQVALPRLGHRAWFAGLCGGLLPDADFLLQPLSDPALPWDLHRHFTHSLVMVPLLGAFTAWVLGFLPGMRGGDRRALFLAATLGVLTHGPLDWLTSFGTRVLWPFTDAWLAADLFPIVDPLLTLVLLVGVVVSARTKARAGAVAAFAFVALYLGVAVVQHGRALDAQSALAAARGHSIERGRAMPQPGSLLVWRSIYETDGVLVSDVVRPGVAVRGVEGTRGERLDVGTVEAPREPERVAEVLRRFARFADGYTAWVPSDPDVVGDMRYGVGGSAKTLWGIRVGTRPGAPAVLWAQPDLGGSEVVGALWAAILGRSEGLRPLESVVATEAEDGS